MQEYTESYRFVRNVLYLWRNRIGKTSFYLKDYAYEDAQQAYAAETLFELFEKNGIYCMPLKGIRTKQFYPYPEFRTMGDLDILYKEDQTKN